MCLIVSNSVTPWTVACQATLFMAFSRQEYWSGLGFLLQGIFPTQGSNLCLFHWQAVSLPLSHLGSSIYLKWANIKCVYRCVCVCIFLFCWSVVSTFLPECICSYCSLSKLVSSMGLKFYSDNLENYFEVLGFLNDSGVF